MNKAVFIWMIGLISILPGFAQSDAAATPVTSGLTIKPEDVYISQGADGGYHLYIHALPGLGSVLLTESTEDTAHKADTYALRDPDWHSVNGDEKRLLNGEFLTTPASRYSLIDSTVEPNEKFGSAFHIYIPYIVKYGYPWSRNGEIQFLDGTYFSIRAFPLPYGDYANGFKDNPFILRVIQKPLEGPPAGNYMKDTVTAYTKIAGEGDTHYSLGEDDVLPVIDSILKEQTGPELDLVIALDTTESMLNDIPYLQKELVPLLQSRVSGFKSIRVGIVLYKDYAEDYVTRIYPFTSDFKVLQSTLMYAKAYGVRDIPEAVFEALYAGITGFPWLAKNRVLVLVGDAPPHPRPRGMITEEMVQTKALESGITIHTIILPQ